MEGNLKHKEIKEFDINKNIKLKLENGNVEIYIAGKKFIQCKKIAIDIPIEENVHKTVNKINYDLNKINSIDDFEEMGWIDLSDENPKNKYVSAEIEFFVHCSNIQAWYENEYDTRILHSNLSFPLLKELTKIGVKGAEIKLKEEVLKRIESGNENVIKYLFRKKYLKILDDEELYYVYELMLDNAERYRSDLVFPLLKKIADDGNLKAIKIFKHEIFKRIKSGDENVIHVLSTRQYFDILNDKEMNLIVELLLDNAERYRSDLVFPLLKKIADDGTLKKRRMYNKEKSKNIKEDFLKSYRNYLKWKDIPYGKENQKAKKILKKEMFRRVNSGKLATIRYLFKGNYFEILDNEEMKLMTMLIFNRLEENQFKGRISHLLSSIVNNLLDLVNEEIRFKIYRILLNEQEACLLKELETSLKKPFKLGTISYIKNNSISEDPIFSVKNRKICSLILNWQGFEEIPFEIFKFRYLERLYLKGNRIKTIPKEIARLFRLKEIALDGNRLTQIGSGFNNLKWLKRLTLNSNPQLKEISENLTDLQSIKTLLIFNTRLANLPKNIGKMRSLKILYVENTNLKTLPLSIKNLKHLKKLRIDENVLLENKDIIELLKKNGVSITS